jgi:hypothetical protein
MGQLVMGQPRMGQFGKLRQLRKMGQGAMGQAGMGQPEMGQPDTGQRKCVS